VWCYCDTSAERAVRTLWNFKYLQQRYLIQCTISRSSQSMGRRRSRHPGSDMPMMRRRHGRTQRGWDGRRWVLCVGEVGMSLIPLKKNRTHFRGGGSNNWQQNI
jgi:hypothetical protein